MSGHNKWSKIKRKKGLADAQKSKAFGKLVQQIADSARRGGVDPDMNFELRGLIDQAKEIDMPADSIERAIAKVGDNTTTGFEPITYEGYGPYNVAIIVDVLTDNSNRVVAAMRQIFSNHGGKLGDSGSVTWKFSSRGMIVVRAAKLKKTDEHGQDDLVVLVDDEKVLMALMEVDNVLDIKKVNLDAGVGFHVYTLVKNKSQVEEDIKALGYIVIDNVIIKIAKIPKEYSESEKEKINLLVKELEGYIDVQNVWTDVKS